ncbi:hypothetical protein RFI_03167 [Reticulomyxa filosa]|uniref:Protein kinase domain-containing protein n=1 Tax=Reticulomyxa filosa TaxID=46433 RepID=X6P743_RETFI|nr:hypothetical protein RFI_03167 [Reticulomyxa filosa]|eukprot:ETO33928.1 hypothetical protein RFI_03167 [Reticulomyxa filosa]
MKAIAVLLLPFSNTGNVPSLSNFGTGATASHKQSDVNMLQINCTSLTNLKSFKKSKVMVHKRSRVLPSDLVYGSGHEHPCENESANDASSEDETICRNDYVHYVRCSVISAFVVVTSSWKASRGDEDDEREDETLCNDTHCPSLRLFHVLDTGRDARQTEGDLSIRSALSPEHIVTNMASEDHGDMHALTSPSYHRDMSECERKENDNDNNDNNDNKEITMANVEIENDKQSKEIDYVDTCIGETQANVESVSARSMILHNNFEIRKWLGIGGFGKVAEATHRIDQSHYAIKIIPFSSHCNEDKDYIPNELEVNSYEYVLYTL